MSVEIDAKCDVPSRMDCKTDMSMSFDEIEAVIERAGRIGFSAGDSEAIGAALYQLRP